MGTSEQTAYRVLARKYRPDSFSGLIGQDALVRTLSNAIALGRLAHAFVLTGVRGVGKTSTARILAKGLNCQGADGQGGPTLEPCGMCEPCKSISEGRHVDVLEMDAASNTGVDDVREIIDGAAYRPVSARFKIYIIDEVHMLSKSAFNALLKTLEEPPEAVKFIFATTEIRKVPVTILSRCQRFDLRRVPADLLTQHLSSIAAQEAIPAEEAALRLIAIAGEGSVRDALSLLDQAAALAGDGTRTEADDTAQPRITPALVNDMLGRGGMAETGQILQACLDGQIETSLAQFSTMVGAGAEAEQIIADLLELTHQASLSAAGAPPEDLPEATKAVVDALADMGIARLGRAWQILLNGHAEMRQAPNPVSATQMLLIRLGYTAPMPTPAEILEKLPDAPAANDGAKPSAPASVSGAASASSSHSASANRSAPRPDTQTASDPAPDTHMAPPPMAVAGGHDVMPVAAAPMADAAPASVPTTTPAITPAPSPATNEAEAGPVISSLSDIAALCDQNGERILAAQLRNHIQLVSLAPQRLDVALTGEAPTDLLPNLAKHLSAWTGQPFMVSLSKGPASPTLRQAEDMARDAAFEAAASQPVVADILALFPGAAVTDIIDNRAEAATPETETMTPENPDTDNRDAEISEEEDSQ